MIPKIYLFRQNLFPDKILKRISYEKQTGFMPEKGIRSILKNGQNPKKRNLRLSKT
jgi:hypothetical protein